MIDAKKLRQQGGESARLSDDAALLDLAPVSSWSQIEPGQHFAQFYESDGFIVNSVAGYAAAGLAAGEAVIIIATQSHHNDLELQLRQRGIDVTGVKTHGQYVALDAAAVLACFIVRGSPDVTRFNKVISGIIERTAKDRTVGLRIFGEMVALLWQEGNHDAAIRLEELWNELHKRHPFTLFCAYPLSGFGREAFAGPLKDVCATHTRIIPTESYTEMACADSRLRTILQLQQKAEALQAEIAERELVEATLRKLKEELELQISREQMARSEAENANRMKDEFLATVSHELRTPLNAIIGWTYMLRTGQLNENTAVRALETIDRNAKVQAQLVEDILDVSRVITGKLRLNMGPVDIASVVNSAIDSVQLAAESKGIQLVVTMDPSARHILGDAGRLQQVVWNLLANGIKFTPSGGKVEVKLARVDGSAHILISDSGQGIKPEFIPFIFDRFRQADGTSTRQHGGLGLGLAIVRHLVELHGGTVSADSPGEEGSGSTFSIKLSLASGQPVSLPAKTRPSAFPRQTRSGTSAALPSLENVRVLIVDNDEDTLQILSAVLREQRANVQAVSSAAEALEVMQWFRPNVLVSDLAMPDEDGYSLIRKVRALEQRSNQQIAAVALTAYVRIEDRAQALSAGFNMFVPKPVEPHELIIAVSHLVESANGKM